MFETKKQVKDTIKLYCNYKEKYIVLYDETITWDVSIITFNYNQFNNDIIIVSIILHIYIY